MQSIARRDGRTHSGGQDQTGARDAMLPARASFTLMAGLTSLMALSIALACGAFAAGPGAAAAVKAEDLAGRWTGNHFSYAAARAKCDGKACALTIDITKCASGWCGVLVAAGGTCGAAAMKVEVGDGKDSYLHFNGRLALDAKAADYAVQVTLWRGEKDGVRHLDVIGDTGAELMFYRRSFPFQARLARTGDAVCMSDKATS